MASGPMAVTGVILAGGRSRRMGRDKALLDLGGRPMLARVAEALGRVCQAVVIVDREPGRYAFLGFPVVVDRRPGFGALSGLHAGLLAMEHPYGIFVACDMPFLDPALLAYMARCAAGNGRGDMDHGRGFAVAAAEGAEGTVRAAPATGRTGRTGYDAVVPRRGGRPEPLHAVYGRGLIPAVEDLLARGGGPLRLLLTAPGVRVRWVEEPELRRFDPKLRSLTNVNTPEDYERAVQHWTR